MLRYAVLCFVVSSVCGFITEDEKAQMHENLKPIVKQCADEMGVTKEMIDNWNESHMDVDPCFMSCIMKAEGVLDEEGMFNQDVTLSEVSKVVKNEEKFKKVQEINEICNAVNKETVKDGAKGCDRASLLWKCFADQKQNIGFA